MKRILIILLVTGNFAYAGRAPSTTDCTQAWEMLDTVRLEKKRQLERYFAMVTRKAHSILSDTLMGDFFRIKQEYYQLSKKAAPPPALTGNIIRLKELVRERYLSTYLLFYDIMLIDVNGDVFYTVRKQADYHKNIFTGELGKTSLAKRLRSGAKTAFVDYSYYSVSEEPSAFMIEPVLDGEKLLGWFVLQNAVNKINAMFSGGKEFGATGEVFLVNKTRSMLTDSRFLPSSTILRKQLSAKNVEEKFRERKGHKIVTDYRGYRAMTSFEVIPVQGSEWLLIAKVDEDEVVTEKYMKNRSAMDALLQRAGSFPGSAVGMWQEKQTGHCIAVDMDEFQRSGGDHCLATNGVSTCTAVIISLPGRFSYLAHVSPYDRVYGGTETDLLGYVMKRIRNLEILPCEKRELSVVVVSPVNKSFSSLVDFFTGQGVFLSQIRMVCRQEMRYVNVTHESGAGQTVAEWVTDENERRVLTEMVSSLPTLGKLATSAGSGTTSKK
jgi:hypothetical protein